MSASPRHDDTIVMARMDEFLYMIRATNRGDASSLAAAAAVERIWPGAWAQLRKRDAATGGWLYPAEASQFGAAYAKIARAVTVRVTSSAGSVTTQGEFDPGLYQADAFVRLMGDFYLACRDATQPIDVPTPGELEKSVAVLIGEAERAQTEEFKTAALAEMAARYGDTHSEAVFAKNCAEARIARQYLDRRVREQTAELKTRAKVRYRRSAAVANLTAGLAAATERRFGSACCGMVATAATKLFDRPLRPGEGPTASSVRAAVKRLARP